MEHIITLILQVKSPCCHIYTFQLVQQFLESKWNAQSFLAYDDPGIFQRLVDCFYSLDHIKIGAFTSKFFQDNIVI